MNPKVDQYMAKATRWKDEMQQFRMILLDSELREDFKWRSPTYTFNGKNLIIIGSFKDFCTMSFFKGVLLKDAHHILEPPGENSQSARLFKTTSVDHILEWEPVLRAYIKESIGLEKKGVKVEFSTNTDLDYPVELLEIFDENPDFKAAFEKLTPGKRRGYNLFFTGAKQSKTRTNRIEKYINRILDSKGINDCVCGHSKRMPRCDGSHKYL